MWSLRKDFLVVKYTKLALKINMTEALLLGTFKIKLDKAILNK